MSVKHFSRYRAYLFRPGVTVGRWSICGSPAAAGSDSLLSVEEEERSESVRGAALHGACSPSMLCSGDPGVSGLLGHVSNHNQNF